MSKKETAEVFMQFAERELGWKFIDVTPKDKNAADRSSIKAADTQQDHPTDHIYEYGQTYEEIMEDGKEGRSR